MQSDVALGIRGNNDAQANSYEASKLMYTRSEFAPLSKDEVFGLIRSCTLATLVSTGPEGFMTSHLPFLIDEQRGEHGTLRSHLARANPHTQLILSGCPSLVVFTGPQGYISPSWYPARDSAPSWNFAVVHCHGRPQPLDTPGTATQLLDLVEQLERDKLQPWSASELGEGGVERRLPRIVGFEIPIERLEAKFKMGQDEHLEDMKAVIRALSEINPSLAQMMSRYNAQRQN